VTLSLKNLPSIAVERIKSYALLEITLEAVQERLNAVFILVFTSTVMESSSDQLRIINALYEQLLPQSKAYLNAKRNTILVMATAQSADRVLSSYSASAASLLSDKAIPLIDELYLKLSSGRR
jgi:hypothetical protein